MPESSKRKPWYRRSDYRGAMNEENKAKLDAIRQKEPHPATKLEELPDDVQSYINRIENELYDSRQDRALANLLFCIGLAILTIYLIDENQRFGVWGSYLLAVILICFGWMAYRKASKENWIDFMKMEEDGSNFSDLGIQEEWELNYISRTRR